MSEPANRTSDFRNPPISRVSEVAAAIARIAGKQGGHVTRAQLLAVGLGEDAIDYRQRSGSLIRVHRGVYAVGHSATNPIDAAQGALLAAGERSALMGRSAASVWELYTNWKLAFELISPLQRRVPGLVVATCSSLLRRDVRVQRGVRVTSPARTLLDLAPNTPTRTLDRFHNELRMRRLVDNGQLIDVAARNPRHSGARALRELAGESQDAQKRSQLEVDWPAFAAAYGLPEYEMNVFVAGYRVDVLFTPAQLIVELDGWDTHGTKRGYERDRLQDADVLERTGIPTVRITSRAFRHEPGVQAARLHGVLARRP